MIVFVCTLVKIYVHAEKGSGRAKSDEFREKGITNKINDVTTH